LITWLHESLYSACKLIGKNPWIYKRLSRLLLSFKDIDRIAMKYLIVSWIIRLYLAI